MYVNQEKSFGKLGYGHEMWVRVSGVNRITVRNDNKEIQKQDLSQLMRLWYLSHRRPAKARASLRVCAV